MRLLILLTIGAEGLGIQVAKRGPIMTENKTKKFTVETRVGKYTTTGKNVQEVTEKALRRGSKVTDVIEHKPKVSPLPSE